MEETWELAVVMQEYGHPEPVKYNVGRLDNDWSSRHVRLRIEMLIASSIFFLTSSFGAKVINLPFLELPAEFNSNFVIWISLGFSIFCITSFLFRSKYEEDIWPKQDMLKFSEQRQFVEDYNKIVESAKFSWLDENSESFLQDLYKTRSELRGFSFLVAKFESQVKNLHDEKGRNSPVHPKFWVKLVQQISEVRSVTNNIVGFAEDVVDEGSDFSFRRRNDPNYAQTFRKMLDELQFFLEETKHDVKERIVRLKRHTCTRWVQTYLLSVYIPILSAVALLLIGLFKIIGN